MGRSVKVTTIVILNYATTRRNHHPTLREESGLVTVIWHRCIQDAVYVTEAKIIAKKYLAELFEISDGNIRVDEVKFADEHDMWQITLSFSCPWGVPDLLSRLPENERELRTYKCVHVSDRNGEVGTMLDRLLPAWNEDEMLLN